MCEWAEEHDVLRWGLLDPARRRRAVNREKKTLLSRHARAAAGLEQEAAKVARLWLLIRGQRTLLHCSNVLSHNHLMCFATMFPCALLQCYNVLVCFRTI